MTKTFHRDLTPSIDPEVIRLTVQDYLAENPPAAGEPLLAAHIIDPNPHPVANTLPDGHFVTVLRNGMA